ncbi:MAG: hypothetical protein ACRDJG_07610 [Actinomycetota bacterium]
MKASRPSWSGLGIGILLVAVALGIGGAGVAHAEGSAPTPEPSCAPGELCVPAETPQPGEAGEGARAPANDPPGRYLRSLSTMGLIAMIVGAYFYVAFTGKSLRLRRGGR